MGARSRPSEGRRVEQGTAGILKLAGGRLAARKQAAVAGVPKAGLQIAPTFNREAGRLEVALRSQPRDFSSGERAGRGRQPQK